jgi:hypothetical protein
MGLFFKWINKCIFNFSQFLFLVQWQLLIDITHIPKNTLW